MASYFCMLFRIHDWIDCELCGSVSENLKIIPVSLYGLVDVFLEVIENLQNMLIHKGRFIIKGDFILKFSTVEVSTAEKKILDFIYLISLYGLHSIV